MLRVIRIAVNAKHRGGLRPRMQLLDSKTHMVAKPSWNCPRCV